MATVEFNKLDELIARWRLTRVISHIDQNDRVLDFGCGSQGFFLNRIQDKIELGVGLDQGIAEGKTGKLEFINRQFTNKLPLKDKTFDKVVMLAVLEHLTPKTARLLFKEYARVLKSRGRVVLTTPTKMAKPVLELMAGMSLISKKEIRDHVMYYGQKEMGTLAQDTGFKIVSYKLFQLGLNSVAVLEKN